MAQHPSEARTDRGIQVHLKRINQYSTSQQRLSKMHQRVRVVKTKPEKPTKGSAGLESQCMGMVTTISAVANATGGLKAGNLISTSNK